MDRLPVSNIPVHDFEDAKWDISGQCERLMTDQLHSQHPNIDRLSIEADVRAFLRAHRFDRELLNGSSGPRARSLLVRQQPVVSSLARPLTQPTGSRRRSLFKTPTTSRPRLTRVRPVASSSSASTASVGDFSSGPPSTPRYRHLRTRAPVAPVTPQSRLLPRTQSRTPQTRRAYESRPTVLTYRTLKNAYEEFNGNIALMVRNLHQLYPSLSIDDITQDVESISATLR